MNNPQDSPEHLTGFPLRYGISVGVVSLGIIIILVALYVCNYKRLLQQPAANTNTQSLDDDQDYVEDMELGVVMIDGNFPRLQFSQAKLLEDDKDFVGTCCAICLGDYKDEDLLRRIPDCAHVFHADCIGRCLRLHGTCPICRSSLHTLVTRVVIATFISTS